MRHTKKNVKDEHGVIHNTESFAKEYAWTMCGQIYPHKGKWTVRAVTCLTCVALTGAPTTG